MFNPLVDSLTDLTDSEIEDKIIELSRKYFMTHNPAVQQQINVILEMFKDESRARQAKQYKKMKGDDDSPLDNLINVS